MCNIEYAQWVELSITSTELNVVVWNSKQGTSADKFTIVKGKTSARDTTSLKSTLHSESEKIKDEKFNFYIIVSLVMVFFFLGALIGKYLIKRREVNKSY